MLRKTLSALLLSSICGIACAAHDLTTINNTDFPSTAYINNMACSTSSGDGVTEPHHTKTIPGWKVGLACLGNASHCTADVFLDRDCGGIPIATVVLDTSSGILSIDSKSTDFEVRRLDAFVVELRKING